MSYDIPLLIGFTFCLSLTAGGILGTFRDEQSNRHLALRYLQYFLIFHYVFGFYSLWSILLISRFLSVGESIATTVSYLGTPFLAISLTMQLIWANHAQIRPSNAFVPFTLLLCVLAIALAISLNEIVADPIRAAYSICGFVVAVAVAGIFGIRKSVVVEPKWKSSLIGLVVLAGLLHLSYFTRLSESDYYKPAFAFLFFLFNTALALLFVYTAKAQRADRSFESFATSYDITKREGDVVAGIYAGKTNQEIADQLFITLQTVKDHSSRIYQKTNVKNRTQLAALLRKSQS